MIIYLQYCFDLVACVGFDVSKYSALESDGLLTATLVLTGVSQLTSFNVIVIADFNNDIVPSATGMYVVLYISRIQYFAQNM